MRLTKEGDINVSASLGTPEEEVQAFIEKKIIAPTFMPSWTNISPAGKRLVRKPNASADLRKKTTMSTPYIAAFDAKVYNAMRDNPPIKRHHQNYPADRYAPVWKTMEFMTMGNLCSLYNNILSVQLKSDIATDYGCSVGVFINYIDNIRVIRNKCAHGGCLYNIKLPLGVKTRPAAIPSACRQYIAGEIGVIDYMLGKISNKRQSEFRNGLNNLLKEPRDPKTQQIIADCTKILLLPFVI